MKFLHYLLPATFSLLIATSAGSADLKAKATDKLSTPPDNKTATLLSTVCCPI